MTRIPASVLRLLPFLALWPAIPAEASALRWEPAANAAAIVLPVPAQVNGIVGASLHCRAGEWAFLLRAEREAPAGAMGRITIDGDAIALSVKTGAAGIEAAVPRTVLDLLRDGTAMRISVGEGASQGESLSARFALAGSGAAIEAAAARCSPPEVTGFEAVALVPGGPAADQARLLLAEEIELFREAAKKEPALAAALVPAGGGSANGGSANRGNTLLFASLCGSARYYGESGCKLVGFAADAAGAWRPVYESEGMHLFRDPRIAHEGWPDLLTLPLAGAAGQLRWTWQDGYQVQEDGAAIAGDTPAVMPGVIDELRTGGTTE